MKQRFFKYALKPLLLGFISFWHCVLISQAVNAQSSSVVTFTPEKGLHITTADRSMDFRIGIRLQQMLYLTSPVNYSDPIDGDLIVRRARFQTSGYVLNKKLGYFIQFDMDKGNLRLSNAEYRWKPDRTLLISFGQLRPPAGRQFQVISKNFQMVDRSTISRFFAIGYDQGVAVRKTFFVSESFAFKVAGGLTHGEGINETRSAGGLAYTARIEVLPFGIFKNSGDYSESDLTHEEKPKLSIGAAVYHNHDAYDRLGGTMWSGKESNIQNYYMDGVFKYKGYSLIAEYISRHISGHGRLVMPTDQIFYSILTEGHGFSVQGGKVINEIIEPTFRVSILNPLDDVSTANNSFLQKDKATIGLNYFFNKHAIKIQSELSIVSEDYATSGYETYLEFLAQFSLSF